MALIETTPRVHQLAFSQITDAIPLEFVRSPEEQPGITTLRGPAPKVPTVNLGVSDDETLTEEVAKASRDWGMFQVVNHGIPAEVISELQRVGKTFFELPAEEDGNQCKLYNETPKEVDGKKAWVNHLFHEIWPPNAINYTCWPKNPPSYRAANEEYAKLMRVVATRLLRCLSRGLGLGDEELTNAVGGDELVYLMKINYYPPCPRPDLALGVVAHTDMSALTILVPNHVQGLQAFKDEHWIDVEYIPNALVVHIGDQMEIVSNGKYKSVLHRTTVNKEETRMSWPVFVEPPANQTVEPIPKLVSDSEPTKYKSKKYSDYKYCKLNKLPQ